MLLKIYLCGPMSGLPDYNYPAFEQAKDYLEKKYGPAIEVLSPHVVILEPPHEGRVMTHLRNLWDLLGDGPCPMVDGKPSVDEAHLWRWCMKRTRMQLACSDLVCTLPLPTPDWKSKGMEAECKDAEFYQIPVIPLYTFSIWFADYIKNKLESKI